jgi:hypothetical protein
MIFMDQMRRNGTIWFLPGREFCLIPSADRALHSRPVAIGHVAISKVDSFPGMLRVEEGIHDSFSTPQPEILPSLLSMFSLSDNIILGFLGILMPGTW